MEQYICTVSPFITALFSVKDWLVNIFPIAISDHSMLCNLALHTQVTFQRVDCKEKLNLNRVLYRSDKLSLQLNRPLRNMILELLLLACEQGEGKERERGNGSL